MELRRNSEVLTQTLSLAGCRVLDVGCGEGHLTRLMTQQGATVVGLECSPRQMEKALSYDVVGDETYIDAVAQSLPFDDDSQDIVLFFNSLHHVPVEDQFLGLIEATRVLKQGGYLYISEPVASGPHFELLRPIDDETVVRAEAYKTIQRFEELGLNWEKEETYNHPVRRKSFEEMRDKMTGPNPERDVVFEQKDQELRAAFKALGTLKEDGYTYFDQPTRMNLLRKK